MLLASGYIAGGSLAGVVVAFLEFAPQFQKSIDLGPTVADLGSFNDGVAVVLFALLIAFFVLRERVEARRWVAGALIMAGIVLMRV